MALVTILLLLFFILGVSFSPLAVAIAINTVSPDRGRDLGRWAIRLGLQSIYRPAVTFNAADELTLKRRSYDEAHNAEYISFGGLMSSVKRYLHDPQNRIHSFYGVPFGFVDELFGLVVDPRDVELGRALRTAQANGQYEYRRERSDSLYEAVRAVFEVPRGGVGVRLPDVVTLVGGSADSQVVDRIRNYYEESQAPRANTTALKQMLVPLGAFLGVVLMGFFIAGQGGGGGGPSVPSGNTSTINVGSGLLLLLISARKVRNSLFWIVFAGVGALIAIGLYLAFPVTYPLLGIPLPLGVWASVAMGLGLITPPFAAAWLGRSLGALGLGLGKLYMIIGLLAFDRPIIAYDDGAYHVVEYDSELWAVEPKWYRFAMNRIGVGFRNDEGNWPDGTTLSRTKVKAMADGGMERNAPTGHSATDLIAVDDILGFVPDEPDPASVHVRTDRTTGWYHEAGQPRRHQTAALGTAKEDYGGGRKPVGDKWIMGATIVMTAMGALFDYMVFF